MPMANWISKSVPNAVEYAEYIAIFAKNGCILIYQIFQNTIIVHKKINYRLRSRPVEGLPKMMYVVRCTLNYLI